MLANHQLSPMFFSPMLAVSFFASIFFSGVPVSSCFICLLYSFNTNNTHINRPFYGVKVLTPWKIAYRTCISSRRKRKTVHFRVILYLCSSLYFFLNHLSNHLNFITNSFKCFSKTNSTDPRQCVPLMWCTYKSRSCHP